MSNNVLPISDYDGVLRGLARNPLPRDERRHQGNRHAWETHREKDAPNRSLPRAGFIDEIGLVMK